jgi:hypothetical protein
MLQHGTAGLAAAEDTAAIEQQGAAPSTETWLVAKLAYTLWPTFKFLSKAAFGTLNVKLRPVAVSFAVTVAVRASIPVIPQQGVTARVSGAKANKAAATINAVTTLFAYVFRSCLIGDVLSLKFTERVR